MLAFSAVHQGDSVKRQSWTKWLLVLRPYHSCVGVWLVFMSKNTRVCVYACVNVRAPCLECDSRGSGSRFKISSAVFFMHLSSNSVVTVRKAGGEGMHHCTFPCNRATIGCVSVRARVYRNVQERETMHINVRYVCCLLFIKWIMLLYSSLTLSDACFSMDIMELV